MLLTNNIFLKLFCFIKIILLTLKNKIEKVNFIVMLSLKEIKWVSILFVTILSFSYLTLIIHSEVLIILIKVIVFLIALLMAVIIFFPKKNK